MNAGCTTVIIHDCKDALDGLPPRMMGPGERIHHHGRQWPIESLYGASTMAQKKMPSGLTFNRCGVTGGSRTPRNIGSRDAGVPNGGSEKNTESR